MTPVLFYFFKKNYLQKPEFGSRDQVTYLKGTSEEIAPF